ncbi:c-type cytochrome biogenesis protein CcsB [Lysobacter korlensis]|uniref:C-type cytochrome biogenesis protein CcsB n=1 Tax=Lysobacter korlensis TaxID=553636 RepID=A0ABV6RSQ4_9GAMM
MNELLTSYSLVAAISAIVVYAFSFIAFTLDLAKRAAPLEQPAAVNTGTAQAATAGGTLTTAVRPASLRDQPPRTSRFGRVGMALATIGFAVNLIAVVLRGLAAGGRVPWSNMYEFALTGILIIVGVFLAVNLWQKVAYLGTYVTGFALLALVLATVNFYVGPVPLPPALQSVWIVVHVLVAILGTAFFALGAGLSALQLLQARREAGKAAGYRFLRTLPGASALESLAYRLNVVGFVFWSFTLIFGAIWAERAWGRYWGWDTKEVWTFIIWVIFAGYIHARATRGWRGSRAAWLAIIGFSAVLFNFTIVNLFFKGLHVYSGL